MGGSLAGGSPVDVFGFGDREGDAYVPRGNGGEKSLQLAYIALWKGEAMVIEKSLT